MEQRKLRHADTDAAIRFLQHLCPDGSWVLTAIEPDTGDIKTDTFTAAESQAANEFIARKNRAGWNLYYSPNPTRRAMKKKPGKGDVARIEYLLADLDPREDETPEEAKARYGKALRELEPTVTVDSGNGIQVLLRLRQPIPLGEPVPGRDSKLEYSATDQAKIDDVEQRAKALMQKLGAKPGTQNIDRVLRLPGTVNYPNAKKRRDGRIPCGARPIAFRDVSCPLTDFPLPVEEVDAGAETITLKLPRNLQALLHLKDKGPYPSRSELLMAFLGEAVRKGMSDEVMISACWHGKYKGNAIYEHCAENINKQGEQYLAKQIAKARKNSKPKAADSGEGEIVLIKATDVIERAVDWLWSGHLARCEQQIMTGDPDLGKSLIQCDMVARATTSKDWPDGSRGCQAGNVIMLTAEDTLETTVKPRLIAAGADLERVFFLNCIKRGDKMQYFLLGEHLEQLQRTINEVSKNSGPVTLVTIDPITAFQGKINSSSPTDVRGQLGPLKALAERTRIAISTVTHPPKRKSEHWLGQFIGSQSYGAAARIAHACIAETLWDEDGNKELVLKDQQRVFFVSTKGNLWGRTPRTLVYRRQEATILNGIKTARIAWEANAIDLTIGEALAASKAPPRTARIDNWLRQLLANGPFPEKEIEKAADEAGFTYAQLRYARKRLHIETDKDGLHGGWYWTLPDTDETSRHWHQQQS